MQEKTRPSKKIVRKISKGNPNKIDVAEQVFATLYYHMCAIMVHMGIHENLKTRIWPKCAAMATKPENIMVNPNKEKCAYEKFCSNMPDYKKY